MAAGAVVWNNLSRASRAVLQADQPPTFAHRTINAHIASVIEQIKFVVADDPAAERIKMKTVLELKPPDERVNQFLLRLAHDGVMQTEPNVLRLACGKLGEPFNREVNPFSLVGPTRVEHNERRFQIREVAEDFSLRLCATLRVEG